MPERVKQFVRYWGLLAAKFLLAGCGVGSAYAALNLLWPFGQAWYDTYYLLYLVSSGIIFLIGVGIFYLAILDQRYRCRVCLRRLRMPVETGSWSKMLQLGRPKMEYICTYGHGTLNIPELHLTGMDNTEWTEHSDYWAELCGTGTGDRSSGRDR